MTPDGIPAGPPSSPFGPPPMQPAGAWSPSPGTPPSFEAAPPAFPPGFGPPPSFDAMVGPAAPAAPVSGRLLLTDIGPRTASVAHYLVRNQLVAVEELFDTIKAGSVQLEIGPDRAPQVATELAALGATVQGA